MKYKLAAWYQKWFFIFRKNVTGEHVGEKIVIDNLRIKNAVFRDCDIIYGGGKIYLCGSQLIECNYIMFGEAGNTLFYLKSLNKSGSAEMIKEFFSLGD